MIEARRTRKDTDCEVPGKQRQREREERKEGGMQAQRESPFKAL